MSLGEADTVGSAFVALLDSNQGPADAATLGGKGASLVRLVAQGHRVPPGFVVTADAFRSVMARLGLTDDLALLDRTLAGGGDPHPVGERILARLASSRLPSDVMAPIEATVETLGLFADNPDGVIVRSSATVEDSSALSFAGIFESIPITRPEDLERTIREVWSSAFSPRALAYASDNGLTEAPSMAVVVQRFLEADRSGVMFTRFAGPGGADRILVEHVEGGCEKLVKGEVTPDRLWLEPEAPVPDDLEGLLHPAHARELARLAASLEKQFGGVPQDVEWCIFGGEVHLVQSRPITAGMRAPAGGSPVVKGLSPLLRGVAASPGAGSGDVHLAFNIDQALALERGRILVTPMTNPDMVVAMRNSAAIVTDVGGMICHAAIVSRELGLPCVVGTETATATLASGQTVTVDGTGGAVYEGALPMRSAGVESRPGEWEDVWGIWREVMADRPGVVPIVPTAAALEFMPGGIDTAVVVADLDLRAGPDGMWDNLEAMSRVERAEVFASYARKLSAIAGAKGLSRLFVQVAGSLPRDDLRRGLDGHERLSMLVDELPFPAGLPLGSAALMRAEGPGVDAPEIGSVEEAMEAAHATERFFGHRPGIRTGRMPDPEWRSRWWPFLPEYGRFHAESNTRGQEGEFEWWNVRPELVISALLKSLVQPGFEMVPRIMGFRHLPPLHIKWIRCRYHFRSDVFGRIWAAIVDATWDEAYMGDLMRRIRWSYRYLEEVLRLFPQTDQEARVISPERIVATITAWWPRWVEFFALCWFIQAQGDDVLYPFIDETVANNLARLGPPPEGSSWPSATDFILPTTPVMSGDYMASVGRLRGALLSAGLSTKDEAVSALGRGEHHEVQTILDEHLANWHWMRDRDLLFEPWDTPGRVIETALKTEPHAPSRYDENLRRNLLGLGFHFDVARSTGRSNALAHAARFLHDLNVERENHHVLWLKYSYPLRRLVLEIERRLVEAGSLDPGDVFFVEMPELLEATLRLPEPMPAALVEKVKNRRLGYLNEARLAPEGWPEAEAEDDYL